MKCTRLINLFLCLKILIKSLALKLVVNLLSFHIFNFHFNIITQNTITRYNLSLSRQEPPFFEDHNFNVNKSYKWGSLLLLLLGFVKLRLQTINYVSGLIRNVNCVENVKQVDAYFHKSISVQNSKVLSLNYNLDSYKDSLITSLAARELNVAKTLEHEKLIYNCIERRQIIVSILVILRVLILGCNLTWEYTISILTCLDVEFGWGILR